MTTTRVKILVVAAHENERAAFRNALKKEEWEVMVAGGNRSGLEQLREGRPDLVFAVASDEFDAFAFLATVGTIHPNTVRLVVVALAQVGRAVAAINDGIVYRFVRKPWDEFDLRVALRLAVRQAWPK